jgi:RHS repeat-associated protein
MRSITFEYDEVGNLIATVDPIGNRTLRFYDAVSRLIALVDARGKGTQFTYDNLNRVMQVQDAINEITSFTYDPNGNLLTVTDAKNHVTTYTYDNMDRLATRKDALNRSESYQYDLAGNLTQFTDRKNQVITFQYDALNRRTQATYADATTIFTYDTVGRLAKASDTATGAGTIDFAYDVLNRLIQEVTGQGSVSYQYDVLGRRTNMVVNGQQPVTYGYDAASRLTQVVQGSLAVGLGYDHANRRTSLTYPNGTSTSYTYDVASRLTNINHIGPSGIIEALTYQYDAAGNRTSLTRNNGAASLLPVAVGSATYDAANEQTAFVGATLQYDANGNLTNDGTNTYVWDARNRLTGISGGVTGSFNYMMGRRVAKTVAGVTVQYLYDGIDAIAEIGGGAVGANYLRSLSIDEPFVRRTNTGNEYYHTDALGSSLTLSDTQGGSATTYRYEPFGKTTATGSSSNSFQFTNREDDGTGISYYRARYYSPARQRFITEDPIGFLGGDANLYAYVRNAPLGNRDPLGLWDPETHRNMTRDAAKACGMSDPDALAQAVYDVDFLITWPIPSFSTLNPWSEKHGMPGSIWPEYASGQLNSAIAGGGLGALGNAIHARQDAYAHALAGKGMMDHLPFIYPNPDDPELEQNKARAKGARRDTINTIRAYMLGKRKTPTCAEE